MRLSSWVAGVALVAVAGIPLACASTPVPVPPVTKQTIEVEIQGCVLGEGDKADRRCDPGVTNPEVTSATIGQTICQPGWTKTVRPPTSYTSPLRNVEMLFYYSPGHPVTEVRYDHLIPLELGGHPTDPENLWPQPIKPSYVKNAEGGRLKDQVCAGQLSLAEAQRIIVEHWSR